MLHLGRLITKDDDEIIGPWFGKNARFFDEIVCIDGSRSDVTQMAAEAECNVVYVHERDFPNIIRTDHGFRMLAHRVMLDRHGHQGWITICHADEFFYHDPRKCCKAAEAAGYDGIRWYALHFLPHPNDLPRRESLNSLPAHLRFRHYHWDYEGSGVPWLEFRSFRNHKYCRQLRRNRIKVRSPPPRHTTSIHPQIPLKTHKIPVIRTLCPNEGVNSSCLRKCLR